MPTEKKVKNYSSLIGFLKTGKTAAQIASNYRLDSVVAAKRMVAAATKAGAAKFTTTKGKKPAGVVGRCPNVYTAI